MSSVTLKDVLAAETRLKKILSPTPLQYSAHLSKLHDAKIYLKREDLQSVRSYKIRGAYNAIVSSTPTQRNNGVVCASAGNHAQGFAWTCAHLNIHGTVFMPATTPLQKVNRVRYFGDSQIDIILEGNTYDEAAAAAHEFAKLHNAYFVHPFDDPKTIAGQGTVAMEIFAQAPEQIDALIVPVGGGGLLAGSSVVTKAKSPHTQLYAIEPEGAACMAAAHKHGEPTPLNSVDTFVDGAAVRLAGTESFRLTRQHGVKFLTVENGRLCKDMVDLYQNDGIVTEPAGALSVAALGLLASKLKGKTIVCIISGGNNDLSRYPEIIERSLIYQGLKHYFLVQFSQRPGQLRDFLEKALGPTDDIVRFEYAKKNNKESGPALVGVELTQKVDLRPLLKRMKAMGIMFQEITDDRLLFEFLV